MPDTRPLVVLLDNIELELEAKGLESTRIRAFFISPTKETTARPNRKKR
jgi:hypothetical protein